MVKEVSGMQGIEAIEGIQDAGVCGGREEERGGRGRDVRRRTAAGSRSFSWNCLRILLCKMMLFHYFAAIGTQRVYSACFALYGRRVGKSELFRKGTFISLNSLLL